MKSERSMAPQEHSQQQFHEENCYDRSKLKILYHAATCPSESLECPSGVVHCCPSKRLFAHICTCTATTECGVPGCTHSKKLWKHYRNCSRNSEKNHHACQICSVVPVPYDPKNFCRRFRITKKKPSGCVPIPIEGGNITDAVSVDVNSVEVAVGRETNQYHHLPVWRKRNLLHAQQHQPHEKENIATYSFADTDSSNTKRSADRRVVTNSLSDKVTTGDANDINKMDNPCPISISSINHRYQRQSSIPNVDDEYNNNTGSIAGRDSFVMQLPVHPRDAKRRPSGPKPVARRSSRRVERSY
ncbi:MAG: hypothetical protein ACI8RD_008284 [Bacillariaceae sp.]